MVQQQEGQVDLVTGLRPLDTLHVARSPYAKVIKERNSTRVVHGMINMAKANSPWRDVRLRRALNHAINRAHFMTYAVKGNGVLVPSFLPPIGLGFDPNLKPYAYDVNKSRQLLQEAGYGDGLDLHLIARSNLKTQATVISNMLQQVGFRVNLQILGRSAYIRRTSTYFRTGPSGKQPAFDAKGEPTTWDVALITHSGATSPASPTFSYQNKILDGPFDWVLEQEELWQLNARFKATRDRMQQLALARAMEHHIHEQAYFLFLYAPFEVYAVNRAVAFEPPLDGVLSLRNLAIHNDHWSLRKQNKAVKTR